MVNRHTLRVNRSVFRLADCHMPSLVQFVTNAFKIKLYYVLMSSK